ncbi:sugar ABC transporter ATP-binding protein [Streptomyces sp. NPDC046261]|uniref:sugar ABC transporter ATP-binding protein n=1 Tax=Streptomyces sp. NPDC046261 TaxID=3157200 RepID=UPI0033D39FC4
MHDTPENTPRPGHGPPRGEPLVRIRGLGKWFGGTRALDAVDLDIHSGSVLALLGPNGAGKSTLIKVLAGIHHPDEGEVSVAGHRLGTEAASRTMSFVHQDLGLVAWMTVAENIALGTGYPRRAGLVSWRRTRRRCAEALGILGAHLDPDAVVADLTRAERSLVAIARALAAQAELIVLDEPTASLPAADRTRLFEVLRTLRDRGHAVVFVTHRLEEVYKVADVFAVLRDGRIVTRGPLAGYDPARLAHDIVGHAPGGHRFADPAVALPVLSLDGVRTENAGPVTLRLHPGEVLGMVGLTGAGHMDLGRALAGSRPILAGRALLDGRPYAPRTVAEAVDAGVGFVTGDRQEEGCAPELTVRENLLANPRAAGLTGGHWISPARERAEATALLDRFSVHPRDSEAPIAALSGGNQQKVMIGRWLGLSRSLLILEEPTAGVDIGAKAAVYRLLREPLAAGLAVLLISTDFEEVATVCHRALVFVRGSVTAELGGEALTVAALTRTASATAGLTGTPER